MVAPKPRLWFTVLTIGIEKASERLTRAAPPQAPDDCWNFRLACTGSGYGRMSIERHFFAAHRLAWALANRADPGEMLVCHKCDNRRCCNPAHLFLGTALDNTKDMDRKGRRVVGDGPRKRIRGPKLTATDAATIRMDKRPSRAIASAYGIHPTTVNRIKRGSCWSEDGRQRRRFRPPLLNTTVDHPHSNSAGARQDHA